MKGIIYYYSSTGNTKLVCEALAKQISLINFELFDIIKDKNINLEPFDIIGFATFTDWSEISQLYVDFLRSLPIQNGKNAFILNTYGGGAGLAQLVMNSLLTEKGFNIIAGHSLHMPHSNPPTVAGQYGILYNKILRPFDSPNKKEILKFKTFIKKLNNIIKYIHNNIKVKTYKPKFSMLYPILPHIPRTMSRDEMGEKFIDEDLCNKCGICESKCPYNAIKIINYPIFDMKKCYGCWLCFNICPKNAIYTKKLRGKGYYKLQIDELKRKLF